MEGKASEDDWIQTKENDIIKIINEENEAMEREYQKNFNWLIVIKRMADYTHTSMYDLIEKRTVDEILTVFSMMETEYRVIINREKLSVRT